MEISPLYSWICFMLCLGLTAGGVLVLFRRSEYRQYASFRYLQYYLILIYTFGFYALWSQWLFRSLFFTVIKNDNLIPLARFLIMISIPFLLVGKLMLVLWTGSLLQRPRGFYLYPILIIISLLILLIYLGSPWTMYRVYAVFELVSMTAVGSFLYFGEVRYLTRKSANLLAGLVVLTGVVHTLLFTGASLKPVFELLYMLLYFLGHTLFVTYFVYKAALPSVILSEVEEFGKEELSFEIFLEKYSITPREAEIVREIYLGKTNQEIADQLFVTIQTIKDHTHRIYQKTEVKNRTQLASLVRKFQLKS